jgi:hypothetical protein
MVRRLDRSGGMIWNGHTVNAAPKFETPKLTNVLGPELIGRAVKMLGKLGDVPNSQATLGDNCR